MSTKLEKRGADEMKRRIGEILRDERAQTVHREMLVDRAQIDEAKRTVALSFASDEPVDRWFGAEILDCTKAACDLKRLRNGGALLLNHDSSDQIGVIESCRIDEADKKCRAVVRFSKSARAQEIFQDVLDGIRGLVSVGYRVRNMVLESSDEDSGDTYRVTEWEPHEISLVSIPADTSVGVGRSQSSGVEVPAKPITKMSEVSAAAPAAPVLEVRQSGPETVSNVAENTRISEIRAIGNKFGVKSDEVIDFIAQKRSLDDFRAHVLEKYFSAKPVTQSPELGMSRKEKKQYSLQRAIKRISEGRSVDALKGTLEGEVHETARKQYGRDLMPGAGSETSGLSFVVPHDMNAFGDREMTLAMLRVCPALAMTKYGAMLERTLQATTFAGAGALVPEEFLGGSFIEILRNRMLLTSLGVGTLSGLVGNVAIPRQSGAATAYWLAEGDSVTATDQSFAQVAATPRRLAAQTAFTKQLLAQAGVDAEALIRNDLMMVLAIAKDLAGIAGTGGKQPLGILNGPTTDSSGASTSNALTTVTFSGAPTWANVLAFEQKVQTQNADIGTMQWLTNPTVRTKWKGTVKVANYPVFLVGDDNKANGYPVNITNQIGTAATPVANQAIFGAWGQAMYCDWAGMDVVVDPYTQAASNKIVVTVNLFTDFIVRHWPSFCISTDSAAQ